MGRYHDLCDILCFLSFLICTIPTALEMARKIYDANPSDTSDEHLAQVYFRLGDLQRFNGAFDSSIAEYTKCIELREAVMVDAHRSLSETYYLLAVTHIYNSSEVHGHRISRVNFLIYRFFFKLIYLGGKGCGRRTKKCSC